MQLWTVIPEVDMLASTTKAGMSARSRTRRGLQFSIPKVETGQMATIKACTSAKGKGQNATAVPTPEVAAATKL